MRLLLLLTAFTIMNSGNLLAQATKLVVKKTDDFTITGNGSNAVWEKASWMPLQKLGPERTDYESKFKILYSSTGIYVLFYGTDNKITTTYEKDFEDLFKADVFEVFFHTDTQLPLYFEYEINQLNKELVLIVPNMDGKINGWIPWHYEADRLTKKMVVVTGGKAEPYSVIKSWSAEIFFPYQLFNPLRNVPPKSGTIWNANFYRLDYDSGKAIKWAWGPIEKTFHEYQKFLPIQFE